VARREDPLNVVSVANRVYEVLHGRIIGGELEAGSRIHQENISEELGVSRTPVREAIARLAAEGLLELLPNKGARVAEVAMEDMRTGYEARLGLEPLAARYAAERHQSADLERMKAAVSQERRVRGARAKYEAIREFHLAVVDAARNPLLARFARTLWAGRVALHVLLRQLDRATLETDADEHEAIAEAIERGAGARAERLMREHIAISLERLSNAQTKPARSSSLRTQQHLPRS
jgi:DNA-binding GntR family transcriptional regulator